MRFEVIGDGHVGILPLNVVQLVECRKSPAYYGDIFEYSCFSFPILQQAR